MCDIFILCFILFLFVTSFWWNFNVMAAAAALGYMAVAAAALGYMAAAAALGYMAAAAAGGERGISQFNLLFFRIFHIFTLQLIFLPYFPYHFTIFICIFQIF